jgi:hypothetical protein
METLNPLVAGGVAAGAAVGARGLVEVWKHLTHNKKKELPKTERGLSYKIPVEVSEEEAAELQRRGVQVKKAMELSTGSLGMDAANAATVVLAAYGGWKALDNVLDKQRRVKAKKKLTATQAQLDAILEGSDEAGLGQAMSKVAASGLPGLADALGGQLPLVGWGLGGGAAIYGLDKYLSWREKSKDELKIKALKERLKDSKSQTPSVELVPVVRKG